MKLNRLEAKIKARNLANEGCKVLHPRMIEVFRPYVGKKIFTNQGLVSKLSQEVCAVIQDVEKSLGIHQIYLNYNAHYAVVFTVKTCVNIQNESGCTYDDACVTIGERNIYNGIELKNLCEKCVFGRTDFTAGEIIAARKKVDDAKNALREAEGCLCQFGEYDA